MENTSTRLRIVIEHFKLTQADFAESIGTTPATLSRQLKGVHKIDKQVALSVQAVYGVNYSWLLTGEGEMFLTSPPSPLLKERGEESSKVMQSDAGNGKQNGHLTGINGNVETYPEITSIEQIARTGWWAKLTEDDRELYAINEELPHEATRRLRDAAEYEYLVNERRIEASDIKKTLRQKGEAG